MPLSNVLRPYWMLINYYACLKYQPAERLLLEAVIAYTDKVCIKKTRTKNN